MNDIDSPKLDGRRPTAFSFFFFWGGGRVKLPPFPPPPGSRVPGGPILQNILPQPNRPLVFFRAGVAVLPAVLRPRCRRWLAGFSAPVGKPRGERERAATAGGRLIAALSLPLSDRSHPPTPGGGAPHRLQHGRRLSRPSLLPSRLCHTC